MAYRSGFKQMRFSPRMIQRIMVGFMLLGLMILAGFLGVGFVRMAWQEHQINKAREQQQAENDRQRARNLRLKGQAEFAESDVAVEQAARERLGMARDGEMVLLPTIVLPAKPTAVPAEKAAPAAPLGGVEAEPATNPGRWVRAFFPGPNAVP